MVCFLLLGIAVPVAVMWQLRRRMAPLQYIAVREQYRMQMAMYTKDKSLESNERDQLRKQFKGASITMEEHDQMLVEIIADFNGGGGSNAMKDGDLEEEATDPILLGMSFFSYKPKYYYWESVDLIRKLLVTSIVVFIEPGTIKQVQTGIFFASIGWGITAYARPFEYQVENMLHQLSLASITLTLTLCAITNSGDENNVSDDSKDGAGIVFGLVFSAVAMYVASAVVLVFNLRARSAGIAEAASEFRRSSLRGSFS